MEIKMNAGEAPIGEQLPENAFRELSEGEEYQPLMSPRANYH